MTHDPFAERQDCQTRVDAQIDGDDRTVRHVEILISEQSPVLVDHAFVLIAAHPATAKNMGGRTEVENDLGNTRRRVTVHLACQALCYFVRDGMKTLTCSGNSIDCFSILPSVLYLWGIARSTPQ